MLRPCSAVIASSLLALAGPAWAGGVRLEVRADGSKVIVNESSAYRSTRLAATLRSPGNGEIADLIDHHARAVDLEPRLVQAVIQVESGYNPRAVSNKGAKGLMQLIDGTAADYAVVNPFDPADNIRAGSAYLRKLWDDFGDLPIALAAYNAGPGAVAKYGGIPPYAETKDYIARVLHLYDDGYPLPAGVTSGATSGDGFARGPRVRLGRDGDNRILITNQPAGRKP
jgi:soluble lytic murein transglycosylase